MIVSAMTRQLLICGLKRLLRPATAILAGEALAADVLRESDASLRAQMVDKPKRNYPCYYRTEKTLRQKKIRLDLRGSPDGVRCASVVRDL
jgi:hypothetical protein